MTKVPQKVVGNSTWRHLRQQAKRIRLPGAGLMRGTAERFTPNSNYQEDFPSRRWPLYLLGSLSGFVGIIFVWSLIARTELIVSAPARLRPSQSPTESRALSSGTSQKIFVKEGELVQKGQAILELDVSPLVDRLEALQNRYARGYASLRQLTRLSGLPMPRGLQTPDRVDSLDLSVLKSSLESENVQREKQDQLKAELQQSILKQSSMAANISMQTDFVKRYEKLKRSGAIADVQLIQEKQRLSDIKSNYSINLQEQQRLRSSLAETGSSYIGRNSDLYQQQIAELRGIEADISQIKQAIRGSLLRAPIKGYVFELSVKFSGVPVSTGQTLFQIIPQNNLVAAAQVPATDIGFIHTGMNVDLHIDSYPSSTYGVLPGKVSGIGKDSIEPKSPIQQPVYSIPVLISLSSQNLVSNGKPYPLRPGMTSRASFKLRSISVFQRFFDATVSIFDPPNS